MNAISRVTLSSYWYHILVHRGPVYWDMHLQSNPAWRGIQIPEFWHGFGSHFLDGSGFIVITGGFISKDNDRKYLNIYTILSNESENAEMHWNMTLLTFL